MLMELIGVGAGSSIIDMVIVTVGGGGMISLRCPIAFSTVGAAEIWASGGLMEGTLGLSSELGPSRVISEADLLSEPVDGNDCSRMSCSSSLS
jgi:hypothetical protein